MVSTGAARLGRGLPGAAAPLTRPERTAYGPGVPPLPPPPPVVVVVVVVVVVLVVGVLDVVVVVDGGAVVLDVGTGVEPVTVVVLAEPPPLSAATMASATPKPITTATRTASAHFTPRLIPLRGGCGGDPGLPG